MKTWREYLSDELSFNDEAWPDVEAVAVEDGGLDKAFNPGYGAVEGPPFTVWTAKNVYFPICYDGSEWVGCVSRHPDGLPTYHQGG